jgi:[pyruvate, water dikinase]-phosphate phosphotransferase / [pyruvate, water dikinase] kinase
LALYYSKFCATCCMFDHLGINYQAKFQKATMTRAIFYVSDSTAMTAKGLGRSLLSQFDNAYFVEYLRPYVDTEVKVVQLVNDLKTVKLVDGTTPIVFASMMDDVLMKRLSSEVDGVIDILEPFVATLERMIEEKPSKAVGRAHTANNFDAYKRRIEAIDFSLATDDGLKLSDYDQADLILLGVSRTGKTPTALYLALNFGLKVANYPFTADDLPCFRLHESHKKNRQKLVGLVISPERLSTIRRERRPIGKYADHLQVVLELDAGRELFYRENIPVVDTTTRSVEEIAASILNIVSIPRLQYPITLQHIPNG